MHDLCCMNWLIGHLSDLHITMIPTMEHSSSDSPNRAMSDRIYIGSLLYQVQPEEILQIFEENRIAMYASK